MKFLGTDRLRVILFFLYFILASLFFPVFQLSLFVPLLVLFADTSRWMYTVLVGLTLGLSIDLISFSFPIGFYMVPFFLISLALIKTKGMIAFYKPLPMLLFFYLSSVATMILLLIMANIFGNPLRYSSTYLALDVLALPIFDTAIAFFTLVTLPFLVKRKFFIEIIMKSVKKRRHG